MKIVISQQGKKLLIEFYSDARQWRGRSPDLCVGGDKADDFLLAVDKFLKKRKIDIAVFKKASLKFSDTGILTERIIRSIINGLNF